jgi:hypothetical protein
MPFTGEPQRRNIVFVSLARRAHSFNSEKCARACMASASATNQADGMTIQVQLRQRKRHSPVKRRRTH